MTHLLVTQLRFVRSEFQRGLFGVTEAEAIQRFGPINCISWMVGHLANQEQRYWLLRAQNKLPFPELIDLVGYGSPASTPPLAEMWAAWHAITQTADSYLDALDPQSLMSFANRSDQKIMMEESMGTLLMRNIYHYWYHTGEAMAVRQMLGHTHLPDFVGDLNNAPYFPEK